MLRQRDLSAPLEQLSENQENVLRSLVRYRFMTSRQLVACGAVGSRQTLYSTVMPRLTKRRGQNLVTVRTPNSTTVLKGGYGNIYALTELGAEWAARLMKLDAAEVPYPIGGVQYVWDMQHREAYIDACIALYAWAEAHHLRRLELSHYFDRERKGGKVARGAQSVNRLAMPDGSNVEPDGMGLVTTETGGLFPFALELHNKTRPKEASDQLAKLAAAAGFHLVGMRHGIDKANLILSVSPNPDYAGKLRELMAIRPGFNLFAQLYRFTDSETLAKRGFADAWALADGTPTHPFS
jgi:DNA-binding PadR family transcriptional regulator